MVTLFLAPAHNAAAEISSDHWIGAVIVGPTNVACNAGSEGSMRYNDTGNYFEICDGVSWEAINNSLLSTRSDVQLNNVQDGQTLIYNAGISKWTNNACDDIPDSFSFTALTQQALSSQVTSNIVQINGIACSTDVTVLGEGLPEYRICGNAGCGTVITNWTRGITSPILAGQYVQLRLNTSTTPGSTFTASLKVGTTTVPWSVTTIMPKRVFLSTVSYNGNLGGLAGADTKCQTLADAVPLGGTFKAWLSDGTTSAASRLTQFSSHYVMINGVRIANSWADLTDGNIANRITMAESGVTLAGAVWTNTSTSGGITGTRHCTNWTIGTSAVQGEQGTTAYADYSWTADTYNNCNQSKRLYCFEQ